MNPSSFLHRLHHSSSKLSNKTLLAQELVHISDSSTPRTSSWDIAQTQLSMLFEELWIRAPSQAIRLEFYNDPHILHVCIDIIKANDGKHSYNALIGAWSILSMVMYIDNANDPTEYQVMARGVEQYQLIELAAYELNYKPLRFNGVLLNCAFLALISPSGSYDYAGKVVETNAPKVLAEIVGEGNLSSQINIINVSGAISVLSWLSMTRPSSIRTLPDIVSSCIPLIPLLRDGGEDDDLVKIGFRAARLLLRTADYETTLEIIHQYFQIIIDFYPEFMEQVLAAGVEHGFCAYSTRWSLSGIMLDLYKLANSGIDKSLLIHIIPLVVDFLFIKGHSFQNVELLELGILFCSSICDNQQCMETLCDLNYDITNNDRYCWIQTIAQVIKSNHVFSVEVIVALDNVVNHVIVQ
jgi:hypothetical protein